MIGLRELLKNPDVQQALGFAAGALAYTGYVLWTNARGAL